jgi:antitoxin (DNA-binding transcriptional repressor) of toxin-antitoxin stability system
MKQGLLLDRIDLAGDHLVVDEAVEPAAVVVAHRARATTTVPDTAVMWTQRAKHSRAGQALVEARLVERVHVG